MSTESESGVTFEVAAVSEPPANPYGKQRALDILLRQILHELPFGITMQRLDFLFPKIFGYVIDFTALNHRDFYDLLKGLPDVCWIVKTELPEPLTKILLPADARYAVCSIAVMLTKFWHNYLCMLATFEEPIPIQTSSRLLVKFLNLNSSFCFSNWGFKSMLDFINYCRVHFGSSQPYVLVNLESVKGTGKDKPKLYVYEGLMSKCPPNFVNYGQNGFVQDDRPAHKPQIQTLRVPAHPVSWITDGITLGQTLICIRGLSQFPYALGFTALNDKVILTALRRKMGNYYDEILKNTGSTVFNDEVRRGTVVGAFFKTYWYRAMVLRRNKGGLTYRVYFLDVAAFANVLIKHIAELPCEACQLPALGILCTLDFSGIGTQHRIPKYNHYQLQRFKSIPAATQIFTLTFIKRQLVLGHAFWTVNVEVYCNEGNDAHARRPHVLASPKARFINVIPRQFGSRGLKWRSTVVHNKIKNQNAENGPTVKRNSVDQEHLLRTYAFTHAV